ncbi:DUF2318 domain-containing protein [Pseudodesulfovibrio indicus]|uniref:DUF2318 domain-containing protein n=1 Tax=Pseudodesulfovibrio indicus TaxID=1716143 RepID=UPI00292DD25A|nr:DUF2318 domain-containing protein [Pseudodesulfovibrio indicus]
MNGLKYVGVIVMLFALGFAAEGKAFWGFGGPEKVEAVNGSVTLPVAAVSDGAAHYYSYDADGKDVKFFVLKSSDGVIRAAFDACDVCYLEKKGYSQDGEFMVCNNCGQKFHSSRINEVRGGCNPSPLARTVSGDSVVISAADIAAGAGYF